MIYTTWNYKTLSANEGWGVVAMLGVIGLSLVTLIVDFFLQIIIKNAIILNSIGLIIISVFTIRYIIDKKD